MYMDVYVLVQSVVAIGPLLAVQTRQHWGRDVKTRPGRHCAYGLARCDLVGLAE